MVDNVVYLEGLEEGLGSDNKPSWHCCQDTADKSYLKIIFNVGDHVVRAGAATGEVFIVSSLYPLRGFTPWEEQRGIICCALFNSKEQFVCSAKDLLPCRVAQTYVAGERVHAFVVMWEREFAASKQQEEKAGPGCM